MTMRMMSPDSPIFRAMHAKQEAAQVERAALEKLQAESAKAVEDAFAAGFAKGREDATEAFRREVLTALSEAKAAYMEASALMEARREQVLKEAVEASVSIGELLSGLEAGSLTNKVHGAVRRALEEVEDRSALCLHVAPEMEGEIRALVGDDLPLVADEELGASDVRVELKGGFISNRVDEQRDALRRILQDVNLLD